MNIQVEQTQKNTLKHIIKLYKDKDLILKVSREKQFVIYEELSI